MFHIVHTNNFIDKSYMFSDKYVRFYAAFILIASILFVTGLLLVVLVTPNPTKNEVQRLAGYHAELERLPTLEKLKTQVA